MMVREDQARGISLRTALVTLAAAAVLTAAAAVAFRLWLFTGERLDANSSKAEPAPPPPVALFKDWPAPDLVLLLSGQEHGYLLPCGCSRPQLGGLERRWNFLQGLKARGWPVAALDLGDIPQMHGPQQLPNVQGPLKYEYAMKAHKEMKYVAVGIGEYEMALPLREALDGWALNEKVPLVLCANLKDKEQNFTDEVFDAKVENVPGSSLKLGVVSVVGPSVAKRFGDKDPLVKFDSVPNLLPRLLKKVEAEKADVKVLLYQGSQEEAKRCAAVVSGFQVILCLSEQDTPSSRPERVNGTLVVSVGHKGKYVGVVGVSRKPGQPFDLRYQLVTLGEEYLTPKDKEAGHPIVDLMEQYTKELKDRNYLAKYVQGSHPHEVAVDGSKPTYVGSDACKPCHQNAFKVWAGSKHAHAYQTLVNAKRPALRQYDGECVVCHVTGFTYKGGFTDEVKTPHLENVGCESCHGPASAHVANPKDKQWRPLLNPWKAPPDETEEAKEKRTLLVDQGLCQKCHDEDNDVHWKFKLKWPEIEH